MAQNPKFSQGLRDGMMNATVNLSTIFDVDALLQIYSGTQPTSANDVPGAGTLLAEIVVDVDAFGVVSNGVLSLNGTWQETAAIAAGTAAWFRLKEDNTTDPNASSTTAKRIDGTVGTTGSTSDLEFTSTTIAIGDQITVDTFTVSLPG